MIKMKLKHKIIVLIFAYLLLVTHISFAIGVRAHIEIGLQAIRNYIQPWREQCSGISTLFEDTEVYPAFYAGCAFPDWGYGEINPDSAEASHWNKFMTTYVSILKQKLPSLPPSVARKEVAFFLGVVVHNISDIPWHFDEVGHRSFLSSAREEGNSSHRDAEFSTDVFLFAESQTEPLIPLELYWPYETILECFKQIDMDVTAEQLKAGCTREQAYLTTGPFLAMTQFESMKQKYNWVYQHYKDYYYGGLEHNASAVSTFMKYYFAIITDNMFIQNSLSYAPYVRRNNDYIPICDIQDTTIIKNMPDNNAGMEPFLSVGKQENNEWKILIRCALPPIFEKENLKKASIWLYAEQIEYSADLKFITIKTQRITTPWDEGTGSSNEFSGKEGCSTLGVNWSTQPEVDGSSTQLIAIPISPNWIQIDITEYVKYWMDNPQLNYGINISMAENTDKNCVIRFFSSDAFRENDSPFCGGERTAYRPAFTILNKNTLTEYLFPDKTTKHQK